MYKCTCQRDAGISYLGKTKRHLTTRIEEHLDLVVAGLLSLVTFLNALTVKKKITISPGLKNVKMILKQKYMKLF